MKRMWGVLGAGLILTSLSCSWFSGPSKPEIIVEFEEMPVEHKDALALSPKWSPDGSLIYFICWNVWDPCICSTDPEGEVVERVFNEHSIDPYPLDISPSGDKVAYWTYWDYNYSACDKIVISDLEGKITDTIRIKTWWTSGRFSKLTDTLFYVSVPYEGLRRYNLKTDTYELIVDTPVPEPVFQFDLFSEDSAVVIGDTVFSLTSDNKRTLPPFDSPFYLTCSINPQEPRYIALSGLGNPESPPEYSEDTKNNDKVFVVDVLADTLTVLEATPRDRKHDEYWGVCWAEFSPDGNSLVYSVFRYSHHDGYEIGLITNVLED